jgi:hypothetical protein
MNAKKEYEDVCRDIGTAIEREFAKIKGDSNLPGFVLFPFPTDGGFGDRVIAQYCSENKNFPVRVVIGWQIVGAAFNSIVRFDILFSINGVDEQLTIDRQFDNHVALKNIAFGEIPSEIARSFLDEIVRIQK